MACLGQFCCHVDFAGWWCTYRPGQCISAHSASSSSSESRAEHLGKCSVGCNDHAPAKCECFSGGDWDPTAPASAGVFEVHPSAHAPSSNSPRSWPLVNLVVEIISDRQTWAIAWYNVNIKFAFFTQVLPPLSGLLGLGGYCTSLKVPLLAQFSIRISSSCWPSFYRHSMHCRTDYL